VATARAAQENRQLVAHQLATAFGEDGGATGETRPLLLAAAGGESFDPARLRVHAAANRVAALASRVDKPANGRVSAGTQEEEGRVSGESLQRGPVSAFGRLRRSKAALFSGHFKLRAGCRLHSGWSGGTLSDGPKLILEIQDVYFIWPSEIR
jgi:hypothetical protein